jgi:DNA polymerase I-like protein with 3'-5' exonuclease and polymerase domains
MIQPKPVTIDFETFEIESRPLYPPMPVGVSIEYWGKKAKYYAFGHSEKNNCCWSEAVAAVAKAYKTKDGVLFQNGKFDLDVAEKWFDLAIPEWPLIHETMFLLFLDDPHQKLLGLKPAAARLLGWDPEEQDAVGDWLMETQPIFNTRITKGKGGPNYFGKYIAFAPGDLVGTYANGDVKRTAALFKLLYKKTVDRNMLRAYQREQQLMPILLEMEQQGLPVDLPRLDADVKMYTEWMVKINAWVIKRLKADADINLDSGAQLMSAMIKSKAADPNKVPLTPTGKYQTNKVALLQGVVDKPLLAVLKYRTQLQTCLSTFMKPWLRVAKLSNGLIYTNWNQVKSPSGDGSIGTRTGRLSSTPNFQNIPNTFKAIFYHELKGLPRCPLKGLPILPRVRSYIVPFKNEVLIDRDYSQQEPRILAHFDGGSLMETYLNNPWIDFHDYAKEELAKMGKFYERKPVKNTNLGLIYGMGVGKLAERNEMSVTEAKELKKAIQGLYPGLKAMYADMKLRAKTGVPIQTWGGREYYCEEPKMVDGRYMHFDYKLVNTLIQGSAADCTKEAIIRFHTAKKQGWRIILNVHDQITVSVPIPQLAKAMEVLRKTMESVEFDVPLLSEGSTSTNNWDSLIDYDKKGERL